jgi:hypothetical protein
MYEKIGKVEKQFSGLICVETDDLLGGGMANAPKFHQAVEALRKEYNFGKWKILQEGPTEYGGRTLWQLPSYDFKISMTRYLKEKAVQIQLPRGHAKDPKALTGAQLVYEGGIHMMHGAGLGSSFYGTDGRVECHRGRLGLWLGDKHVAGNQGGEKVNLNQELDRIEAEYLKDAKVKLYDSNNHVGDFLQAMKSRKKPITNEIVGARTSIACHLLNQTYYNQEAIDWNPQKNTFAKGGDPKWLTRNYRGDWKV